MDFITRPTLWCALLLLTACGTSHETMRGRAQHVERPVVPEEEEKDPSEDAIIQPADPTQAPVIFDKTSLQPLNLAAEADQSGLPTGWIEDIFAIHKIDAGKTLLFGASKQAWLLDESKGGLLTRLTLDLTPPGNAKLYVLENNNFWLLEKNSIGFPSTQSKDSTQITMITIAPDLLRDSEQPPRVLYAGPQRMILANEKRANIILLDGDKARVIALDLPKMKGMPVPLRGAGIMKGAESFWFLSQDYLLLLKKNDENRWRWVVRPFQLTAEKPMETAVPQFALMLEAQADQSFAFVGRTFELTGGKLYEQSPMKLSVDIKADPALDPLFLNVIQPMLRTYCAPCHSGYEDFINVKARAPLYQQMIADGSMPKNMALQPEQIKTLTDYLTKLIATP